MILIYILVLAAHVPNHPLFDQPIAGLTVPKWLGLACCVYAAYQLLRRKRLPAYMNSWEVRYFLLLFCIAELSSLTLSKPGTITFNPMSSYISYLILFFVMISVVSNYEQVRHVMLSVIAGVILASLYVIREYQLSGGMNVRPGYVAGDSNYYSACAVLGIPFAAYLAWRGTSKWERYICAVSLVIILIAFTLASSRGGFIGLCVEIAYMVVRSSKSRRAAIVIALLLLPMLLLSPASPLSRMLHPEYGDQLATQIRWDFWIVGWNMICSHPLTGVGLGNFTAYSYSASLGAVGKQGMACNTLLEVAAELGIPGLLLFCGVIYSALSSAGKLRWEGVRNHNLMLLYTGEAMQAGLLGFFAAAMFVSAEYQTPFWIIVTLSAAVSILQKQQLRPPAGNGGQRIIHEQQRNAAISA